MEKLTAKASIQIQKPINEVFEAIVDPNKMNHYFIKSSTGRLETGKTVEWNFLSSRQFSCNRKNNPSRRLYFL
ncbi:hypothetical protein KUH03_10705 [Sphingobacterium sp. E70]|uniref:hypothetical protein n=1 Tax=Sphingobacterium sp. E70 TaxID=2853439 RepID=UPI00211D095C|nr:hypothetical protein [Sphingobacterium sp. E70]ULT27184.1 hypothetical protein KUH03_10705 [Sphingobacterium sp. E70]